MPRTAKAGVASCDHFRKKNVRKIQNKAKIQENQKGTGKDGGVDTVFQETKGG